MKYMCAQNTTRGFSKLFVVMLFAIIGLGGFYIYKDSEVSLEKDIAVVSISKSEIQELSGLSYHAFPVYVPSKMPAGYRLSSSSIGGGTNPDGTDVYGMVFSKEAGSNRVIVREFSFSQILKQQGETRESFFEGTRRSITVDGKTVYLTPTDTPTFNAAEGKVYAGSAFAVYGDVLVRIEYFGKARISDEGFAEIAASFALSP